MAVKTGIGGHRGMGCTDNDFFQPLRNIAGLPVENTIASIEAAFAAGADYIETDAVMSKDGVLFTLHNVVPKDHFFISDIPAALLNTMDYADIAKFNIGRPGNAHVDKMAQMLDRIAEIAPRTLPWSINIEIKGVQGSGQPYETNDYLKNLSEVVKTSKLPVARVLFSSFCLQNVMTMSQLLPQAQYGMLFAEKPQARAIYADQGGDMSFQYLPFNKTYIDDVFKTWQEKAGKGVKLSYVHPEAMTITPENLAATAAHGAQVNCWAIFEELTADRKRWYTDLVELCAKHQVLLTIITDYVPEMKTLLEGV